jgi:hypothetical protein
MRATRHSPQALACLLVLPAVLLGACVGAGPAGAPTSGASPSDAPSTEAPATEPAATASAELTPAPTESAASPSEPATASPAPPAESEEPTAALGAAGACSGSDDNRDFYAEAAASFAWDVYCPVLGPGWFVTTGEYRLADGGRLEIAYRGPGEATLTLREGTFCAAANRCLPAGTDAGDASFGDRAGTLVALDDGGWAITADGDAGVSWHALGRGLDEAAFREIAARLIDIG